MQFYHNSLEHNHDARPQFEVRNNMVYATIHNKEAAGKTFLPCYEIKGNNIHTTSYNPLGHSAKPMYEIQGNEVHTTLHNPNHSHTAAFHIKK